MSLEKLIHKGSTKDVYSHGENYLFRFSDRYSVFDWGEMPDHLDGKGSALAVFTKNIFTKLQDAGISHHLLNEQCKDNEIVVKPFEVFRDGSSLALKKNFFLPMEIIFRMGFAKGSSLSKRMKCKEDWINAGFDREYTELEMFHEPMIDFTTKLERFDRPLTHEEARSLAGLSDTEWTALLNTTKKIASNLKEIFARNDITLWDGKIELALDNNREIILVDSIGPDELRLTKNGIQLSKEIIRQHYRQTDWYGTMESAKAKHGADFKEYVHAPPKLPKEFKSSVEELYEVLSLCVTDPVAGEFKLKRVMSRLKGFL